MSISNKASQAVFSANATGPDRTKISLVDALYSKSGLSHGYVFELYKGRCKFSTLDEELPLQLHVESMDGVDYVVLDQFSRNYFLDEVSESIVVLEDTDFGYGLWVFADRIQACEKLNALVFARDIGTADELMQAAQGLQCSQEQITAWLLWFLTARASETVAVKQALQELGHPADIAAQLVAVV